MQGLDDVYFVFSSAIVFTAVRAIAIEWIFRPMARALGLKKKASLRFAEQGWLWMYYGFFWSFGMVSTVERSRNDQVLTPWTTWEQFLWSQSSYWLNFSAIWSQWPARDVSGPMKWYLLVQLSFWVQQILVIHIEERRKDHYQMLIHHIITSTLLASAYIYAFYNVSNVVLCLMDIVDLLLPVRALPYPGCEPCLISAYGRPPKSSNISSTKRRATSPSASF